MPTNPGAAGLNEKPSVDYEIEHVHGFLGSKAKSCLYFGTSNEEIIYATATLGVVMNTKTREQRFFGGLEKTKAQKKYENNWPCHQDDITDLAVP